MRPAKIVQNSAPSRPHQKSKYVGGGEMTLNSTPHLSHPILSGGYCSDIEIEPIPDDSVGKYRAEGVDWAI